MRLILPSFGILLIALSRHIFVIAEVTEHKEAAKGNNTLSRNRRDISLHDDTRKAVILALGLLACGGSYTDTEEEEKQKCKINVKELKLNHALIIDPYDHSKFLYPDEKGDIYFDKDEPVFLSCGTNGNRFKIVNVAYETFHCLCDKTFRLNTLSYNFNDLNCEYYPDHIVKSNRKVFDSFNYKLEDVLRTNQENSVNSGTYKYQIGFEVDKSQENFVNLIDVYYEKEFNVTTYVKSEISKFIAGGQDTNVPKPYYPKNCCYHRRLNWIEIIDECVQKKSFAVQIFSESSNSSEDHYIKPTTDYVFDYITLTPPQSMVYGAASLATYSRLNMEAQWKAVNHNWRCIENHVTKMAKVLKKNLSVYTGVYEGLRLVDKTDGKLKDLYLYAHKEREMRTREIPLAAYIFKMVIDFTTNSGVVYITVNNPYIEPGPEHHICTHAYTSMQGVAMPENWEPTNSKHGYSYMCKVDDFQDKNAIFIEDLLDTSINKLLFIPATSTTLPNTSTVRTVNEKDELK